MSDNGRPFPRVQSRRELVGGSAALGAGSVAGCLGENDAGEAPSERASSPTGASTTQGPQPQQRGEGNLGAVQAAADGMVVPASKGRSLGDAIDPETTDTPVQDAIDLINEADRPKNRGAVFIPPGQTDEAEPITNLGGVQIQGFGKQASFLRFPNDTDGIRLTGDENLCGVMGLSLVGPKSGTGGRAIHFLGESGAVRGFHMDQVKFVHWRSAAPVIHGRGKFYDSQWGHVKFLACGGTQCQFDVAGPANYWAQAGFNPFHLSTGKLIHGRWRGEIGTINIGGVPEKDSGPYFDFRTGSSGRIGWINFEVHDDPEPRQSLVRFRNGGVDIGYVEVKANTVADYLLHHDGGSLNPNCEIGRVVVRNDGIRENIIGVTRDINTPLIYRGTSDDIANLTDKDLSAPVSCLGDQTLVT